MKRLFQFFIFFFFVLNCKAQFTSNSKNELDDQFALKVKQIDEFIERFNFDTTGQNFLMEYVDNTYPFAKGTYDRSIFIKSLLNQEANIDVAVIDKLISFVNDSTYPFYLDFYDNDWYALLSCDFTFLGKPQNIELILKNQVKEKKTSKWIIYSIKSELFDQPIISDSTKIINPMSHAVNFMSLDKALIDKENSANYYRRNFQSDALSVFYFLIQKELLVFKQINAINYYFLQIPNWFFKVEYFNRQNYNSGWLISQVKELSIDDKIQFKKEVLNIAHIDE